MAQVELNAEQIKKALECYTTFNCDKCPIEDENRDCENFGCIKQAIALIKGLTEENEKLKAQKYYLHSDGRIEMIPTVESVRADTIDEFVYMVKEKMREVATGKRTSLIGAGWIDEIARELKGE